MIIVAVFLAPLVGLCLMLLLAWVEDWAFENEEPEPPTMRPGATGEGSPATRSRVSVRTVP